MNSLNGDRSELPAARAARRRFDVEIRFGWVSVSICKQGHPAVGTKSLL